MGKYYLISRPVRTTDIDFVDLMDENETWHEKAHNLRLRRWKNLRESMKKPTSKRHQHHKQFQKTF
jgi:hypothetical protein